MKQFKRLFTFGCSLTKYKWQTWADILGELAEEFYRDNNYLIFPTSAYFNGNGEIEGVYYRSLVDKDIENIKFKQKITSIQ